LKNTSVVKVSIVKERVKQLLLSSLGAMDVSRDEFLSAHVESVTISDDTRTKISHFQSQN